MTSPQAALLEFDSLLGAKIFLFSTASKPAIGTSQSAIHCIPEDLSLIGEWLRKPHNAF
jgi:hypothetical protein